MSPLPTHMRDRWKNRADTPHGKGTVYWHILMGGYPEVRTLVEKTQNRLAGFADLHMTPLNWLHMSVLVAGSTDDITSRHMHAMLECASKALLPVAPIDITLGQVLYHPEAIMIGTEPAGALDPMLDAAKEATQSVTGLNGSTTSGPGTWIPHMTVCYSTGEQSADPIIKELGLEIPACQVTINALTLVIQWGPERHWAWEIIDAVTLN